MSSANDLNAREHVAIDAMPSNPDDQNFWWDTLEDNFHTHRETFSLDARTQARVMLAHVVDNLVQLLVATATTLFVVPVSARPSVLKRDHEQKGFYENLARAGDARAFFVDPPAGVKILSTPTGAMGARLPTGENLTLRFESPFQPVNPQLRASYGRHSRNQTAWAQYWRHGDRPRATLCMVHGYALDSYRLNAQLMGARSFYDQGYDILLYTLPFHGSRQGFFSPFPGHGYFAHGPLHINEAMAHAVHDLRIFIDWLLQQGAPQVGLTGISMGGYTTALTAAAESRLAFAIPVIPPASLVDVAFQWFPLGPLLRRVLRRVGVSVHDARRALAVSSPLTWEPALPPDKLLIIAGMGDGVTFPKHARLLARHWHGAPLHWFPGGHLVHFGKSTYLDTMRRFMTGLNFLP